MFIVEAMETALLEIDWQNRFVALAHDPFAAQRARETRRLLDVLGWPVLSTRYLDPGLRHDQADAHELGFIDGCEPYRDPVITKYGKNVFDVSQTSQTLTEMRVKHLVLTGLMTSHGVRLAAETALGLGYLVTVVSDACADLSEAEHDRALTELSAAGAQIRTAQDLAIHVWAETGRERDISLTIAEVAQITGLSRDTLRWYERSGLIPAVGRTVNGYRSYDGRAVRILQLVVRLRRTGMPVAQMRQYIEMVSEGDRTHDQRLALLCRHRDAVQQQIAQLNEDLNVLDHKIDSYQQVCSSG